MVAPYEIYLRSRRSGRIGHSAFDAVSDTEAIVIAHLVSDACSDVCDDFDVWRGARHLYSSSSRGRWLTQGARALSAETQEAVAQVEERLRDSGGAVARSRRLLQVSRP